MSVGIEKQKFQRWRCDDIGPVWAIFIIVVGALTKPIARPRGMSSLITGSSSNRFGPKISCRARRWHWHLAGFFLVLSNGRTIEWAYDNSKSTVGGTTVGNRRFPAFFWLGTSEHHCFYIRFGSMRSPGFFRVLYTVGDNWHIRSRYDLIPSLWKHVFC